MAESKEGLKSFFMRVKEESEKAGLKFNIRKIKIMACSPITSQQIEGGKSGSSDRFNFLGFKITADGDCSHEIKRCLLLGRKTLTHLDNVLKSRDTTLSMKVHKVKAMVFPVVRYGCESRTIKNAERWKIDAFELWCCRSLEISFHCRELESVSPKGTQPWIFIGRTDAEVPILWPPDAKSQLIGEDPDAGRDWRKRRRGWHRMRWLDSSTSMDMNVSTFREINGRQRNLVCCPLPLLELQRVQYNLVNEQQHFKFMNEKLWRFMFFLTYKYPHNILDFASWPAKPKKYTIWPFTENVCWPCSD